MKKIIVIHNEELSEETLTSLDNLKKQGFEIQLVEKNLLLIITNFQT